MENNKTKTDQCAHGRGRNEDFSSPPAQIPACAANAPGSSLGSVVVMMSDLGRSSSDAQPLFGSTRYFGSVSEPRPPNGCSPWVRPVPPRLPPGVASPCSVASQVLWPRRTSHPLTCSACGLSPSRAGPAHESGHGGDRPGSAQRTSPRAQGLRLRDVLPMQAIRHGTMLPSLQRNEIGTSELDPFRSSILGPWSPL